MAAETIDTTPWEEIEKIIDSGNVEHLEAFLYLLAPGDTAHTINRLSDDHQTRLLSMVRPELAAQPIEHLADIQAADLIEELPPQGAAAIVDELDSDDQADILSELNADDAEAILTHMDPAEARDARRLVAYEPDTAGGIMISEYLSYGAHQTVGRVLKDLRDRVEEHAGHEVQYLYGTDGAGMLRGLIRIRDVVLSRSDMPLSSIMVKDPVRVQVGDSVDDLEDVFDRHRFHAFPVVDDAGQLASVVRREAVEEAHGERSDRALLRASGMIAGEELRSMGLRSRSLRRLAYLVPSVLLLVISVSVIAAFEDIVLKDVIALAIFLPLVAGLSGSAANQAVAVSIRELSLGVARPPDAGRVLVKEFQVGLINGLVLGMLVYAVAYLMRGDANLALVVGGAVPLTILIAVCLGGTIPLLLSTVIDFVAFFLVLGFAWLMLEVLTG